MNQDTNELNNGMIIESNKEKRALDMLVSYYMNERELVGRKVQNDVYESAEKMLALWMVYVVDAFTPDMDYQTVKNIEETKMGVIKNIMSFIDKDIPRTTTDHDVMRAQLKAAEERVSELTAEKKFMFKQVERGLFDKHTKPELALKNMFYSPEAPWNDDKWNWDVDHKEYAEEFKQALTT